MDIKLGETVFIDFPTHNTTGEVADAAAVGCEVFEDANDTPIISPTPVKRTGKTGNYRVQIDCTTDNGFEVDKTYNVIASATTDKAGKGCIGTFKVRANHIGELAAAVAAIQTDLGDPSVDATSIYAQLLLVKGYVDTLEAALATHEANRVEMQATLVAEHDATQALVNQKVSGTINIISAIDGALQVNTVEDGGVITVYRKTSIAITFNLGKPMTGRKLYFAVRADIADAAYTIPNGGTTPKDITSTTDLNTGAGYVGLTPTELNIAAGLYTYVEIQSVSDAGGDPVPERIFQLRVKDHALNL